MTYDSNSPQETYALGIKMAEAAVPGSVYCLSGDLGTGKTVFAQGFAEGLGIREDVCSPTFTILQVYEDGRMPLYHFDLYRIGDPEEMDEIGFDEFIYGDGVCLIEWPEMAEERMPAKACCVRIDKDLSKGFDYRRIIIENENSCG